MVYSRSCHSHASLLRRWREPLIHTTTHPPPARPRHDQLTPELSPRRPWSCQQPLGGALYTRTRHGRLFNHARLLLNVFFGQFRRPPRRPKVVPGGAGRSVGGGVGPERSVCAVATRTCPTPTPECTLSRTAAVRPPPPPPPQPPLKVYPKASFHTEWGRTGKIGDPILAKVLAHCPVCIEWLAGRRTGWDDRPNSL